MYIKEIWRYPVKSMAGERLDHAALGPLGLENDRKVLVVRRDGHIVTSRTSPELLGLHATIGADGQPLIAGLAWNSPEALQLVRKTVGFPIELIYHEGPERFDVLPLLVATDGAVEAFARDGRRLRYNILVGGVEGLAERSWPGSCLRIRKSFHRRAGFAGALRDDHVRSRYAAAGSAVLKEIVKKFGGKLALNCFVITEGAKFAKAIR